MMINPELFNQVIQDALQGVEENVRQTNAIQRGAELILKNRCLPEDDETLLTLSPSGHNYRTTLEECRDETGALCAAFKLHRPCKHRAAYQLLVRYHERAAAFN